MKKLTSYLLRIKSSVLVPTACLSLGVGHAVAGPGALSDIPLYVGEGVKPNLLFVVDDSGSMNNQTMISREGVMLYPEYGEEQYVSISPSADNQEEILRSCSGYNVLAYDPEVTYRPWAGFSDSSLTSAGFGFFGYVNLIEAGARFMPWNDAGNIGVFEAGECNELEGSTVEFTNVGDLLPAQQINYANWYTYYRSRNFTMKAALSNVLESATQRVGLATINRSETVATPVADITDPEVREDLIDKVVHHIGAFGGTPLARAVRDAGRYFNESETSVLGEGGAEVNAPILPSGEGGECQQNYMVLMTDGYGNAGASQITANARTYYTTDLATETRNLVNSNDLRDNAEHQHMVTYAVAFGVQGTFDSQELMALARSTAQNQADTEEEEAEIFQRILETPDLWRVSDGPEGYLSRFDGARAQWPSSTEEYEDQSPESIDDLFRATVVSRGEFFSASNPEELINDLQSAVNSIAGAARGTAASVGFNSTNVDAGTLLFQSWFDTDNWQGKLKAYSFSDGDAPDDSDIEWEAGELLAERVNPDNDTAEEREIITYNGVRGVPFRTITGGNYLSTTAFTLGEAQVRDLLADAPNRYGEEGFDGLSENTGYLNAMIEFLRGNTEIDGETLYRKTFRTREDGWVLGDITHSSPVYVGAPDMPYPDDIEPGSSYLDNFVNDETVSNRIPVVYVGANDGMLHAFRATSAGNGGGEELFAYIPGLLFSSEEKQGLHHLASEYYNNFHKPYVDGTPTFADVFIDGRWRTYLVGGLGAGGKGIYVLDITNPDSFSEDNANDIVVTEFTHRNMGYTFSRPQIAKLNNGEWVAIVGNGYNNSGSHEASLFIVYLDGNEGESGPSYREISTGVGTPDDCSIVDSECNGLSEPTILDLNGDALIDRVYAGDIQGNMWVFDLSSEQATDWDIAHDRVGQAQPLFRACRSSVGYASQCPADDRQPITTRPLIVSHPAQRSASTDPNLLVFFGTGQYLAEGDTSETSISSRSQAVYGVWDAGADEGGLQRTSLIEQSITGVGEDSATRSVSDNEVEYSLSGVVRPQGIYGWYMDLPVAKERLVVNPLQVGEFVIFTSSIPSDEICQSGGSGYLMAVSMVDGTQPRFQVFPDRDGETAGIELDSAPGGPQVIDNDIVLPDYEGDIVSQDFRAGLSRPGLRSSWSILR